MNWWLGVDADFDVDHVRLVLRCIPQGYGKNGSKSIALIENTCQSYGASLATWNHAVLLATRLGWTRPAVTHAGRYSIYLPPEGWKAELTLVLVLYRDGLYLFAHCHPSKRISDLATVSLTSYTDIYRAKLQDKSIVLTDTTLLWIEKQHKCNKIPMLSLLCITWGNKAECSTVNFSHG